MPAGDAFSPQQRIDIERAVADAQRTCGLHFSVYVGDAATDLAPRAHAIELHQRLHDPADSVLVYVDPVARALEIVTGERARDQLNDAKAGLAALSMQTSFVAGQLATGIVTGIRQMAQNSRKLSSLHGDNARRDLGR